MKRRIRRALLALALLAVVLAIAGAAYESVARHRAAARHPAPGKLVDVGGRRIQIDCRGSGSPTVVLMSGLDHFGSLSWAPVHDSIARTTRVCAYSRAGIMWSDAAEGAFDSGRMADDLHAALAAAGERPPWVLVGHSMGGPYALAFTGRYGAEVAGLVFVDASHPDQRFPAGASLPLRRRIRDAGVNLAGPALLRMGAARLVPVHNPPPLATPPQAAAHRAYFATSVAALLKENQALGATLRTASQHRQLGTRPLVVLTGARGMSPTSRWMQFHRDQATWSTRGRHEIVDDASHYIHADRPDVVIRAVREVVNVVRSSSAPADPGSANPPGP